MSCKPCSFSGENILWDSCHRLNGLDEFREKSFQDNRKYINPEKRKYRKWTRLPRLEVQVGTPTRKDRDRGTTQLMKRSASLCSEVQVHQEILKAIQKNNIAVEKLKFSIPNFYVTGFLPSLALIYKQKASVFWTHEVTCAHTTKSSQKMRKRNQSHVKYPSSESLIGVSGLQGQVCLVARVFLMEVAKEYWSNDWIPPNFCGWRVSSTIFSSCLDPQTWPIQGLWGHPVSSVLASRDPGDPDEPRGATTEGKDGSSLWLMLTSLTPLESSLCGSFFHKREAVFSFPSCSISHPLLNPRALKRDHEDSPLH